MTYKESILQAFNDLYEQVEIIDEQNLENFKSFLRSSILFKTVNNEMERIINEINSENGRQKFYELIVEYINFYFQVYYGE
jgi:hypothetical protein